MATFEDAISGWDIFRSRNGALSRAQLNAALTARGREPISERTFGHYRKLVRLGYTEYVPINRLDVRHSNDSLFDLSDRSRYTDREYSNPGRLVLPTADGLVLLDGQIVKVSEGWATLRVARDQRSIAAARATKYDKGVLIFTQVGVERAVKVTEGLGRGKDIDLILEFRSLLETDLLFDESPFPQTVSRLTVSVGESASMYRLLGIVHTTFDLFESTRAFVDLVAVSARPDDPTVLTPTLRVRRIEFSNPLVEVLLGAAVVAGLVGFIVKKVGETWASVAEAGLQTQELVHNQHADHRAAERHAAELQSMQLDNIKKAIEVADLLETVKPSIAEVAGVAIPQLSAPVEERLGALKDQAVDAAAELTQAGGEPLDISDDETEQQNG